MTPSYHVTLQRIQHVKERLGAFLKTQKLVFNGEQEKESITPVRMGLKNASIVITICHHLASLVMPNDDPRNGIFSSHPHTHDRFLYLFPRGQEMHNSISQTNL